MTCVLTATLRRKLGNYWYYTVHLTDVKCIFNRGSLHRAVRGRKLTLKYHKIVPT